MISSALAKKNIKKDAIPRDNKMIKDGKCIAATKKKKEKTIRVFLLYTTFLLIIIILKTTFVKVTLKSPANIEFKAPHPKTYP